MASSPSLKQKPLNPHAKSWFPSKKPCEYFANTQKLPFCLPHQIYGTKAVYFDEPLVTLAPVFQGLVSFAATIQNPCLQPFGSFPVYPPQESSITVDHFLMEEKEDVKKDELFMGSETLKQILGISSETKFSRKFIPPRLRKTFFYQIRGRKRLPIQVWKPKNSSSDDYFPTSDKIFHPPKEEKFFKNTTVMLKNIPNQYRRNSLIEFLDKKCFELGVAYDFLYLPMDFVGENLGFGFVNFTTASAANKIKSSLEGYKWGEFCIPNGTFTSKKILQITWAKIQGKDALVKHFVNSRFTCDNIEYLPVVFLPPRNGSSLAPIFLKPIGKLQGVCTSSRTPKDVTKKSG